jgi:hypothetical protein
MCVHFDLAVLLLGIQLVALTAPMKIIYRMLVVTLFMAAKNWKQSEYLSSHIYTMEYFVDMKKTI